MTPDIISWWLILPSLWTLLNAILLTKYIVQDRLDRELIIGGLWGWLVPIVLMTLARFMP